MSRQVLSFHYKLTNPQGEVLDSSEGAEPLNFMTGVGQIIPGLEAALLELKVGDKKKIQVPANEAYGPKDSQLLLKVERKKFPQKDLNVGDFFQINNDANSTPYQVVEVSDAHVTLDGNHPLAGIDLTFDVEVMEVRPATAEEETHGHAHGGDGHHH